MSFTTNDDHFPKQCNEDVTYICGIGTEFLSTIWINIMCQMLIWVLNFFAKQEPRSAQAASLLKFLRHTHTHTHTHTQTATYTKHN